MHTFHANATASIGAGGGGTNVGAIIGNYLVIVHAQPYNYHKVNASTSGSALISTYQWSSTNGYLSSLNNCYLHEYVVYPGQIGNEAFPVPVIFPAPFTYPVTIPFLGYPPVINIWPNPTVTPGLGSNGYPGTTGSLADSQGEPGIKHPLVPLAPGSFIATQNYLFDDLDTGETDVLVPGQDSGTLGIDRSVGSVNGAGLQWLYTLTKTNSSGQGNAVTSAVQ